MTIYRSVISRLSPAVYKLITLVGETSAYCHVLLRDKGRFVFAATIFLLFQAVIKS